MSNKQHCVTCGSEWVPQGVTPWCPKCGSNEIRAGANPNIPRPVHAPSKLNYLWLIVGFIGISIALSFAGCSRLFFHGKKKL